MVSESNQSLFAIHNFTCVTFLSAVNVQSRVRNRDEGPNPDSSLILT